MLDCIKEMYSSIKLCAKRGEEEVTKSVEQKRSVRQRRSLRPQFLKIFIDNIID
jgi:hypothetical protein